MKDPDYDPLEQLVLLSPRARDMNRIPGGYGRLTPQDIAAKLSKCSRPASTYGLARLEADGVGADLFFIILEELAKLSKCSGPQSLYDGHMLEVGGARPRLFEFILGEFRKIVEGEQYPDMKAYALAAIATQEMLDSKICRLCRGHEYVPEIEQTTNTPTGRVVTCWACSGVGRQPYTNYVRAQKASVHRQEWKRSYDGLYTKGLVIVYGWADELRKALRR